MYFDYGLQSICGAIAGRVFILKPPILVFNFLSNIDSCLICWLSWTLVVSLSQIVYIHWFPKIQFLCISCDMILIFCSFCLATYFVWNFATSVMLLHCLILFPLLSSVWHCASWCSYFGHFCFLASTLVVSIFIQCCLCSFVLTTVFGRVLFFGSMSYALLVLVWMYLDSTMLTFITSFSLLHSFTFVLFAFSVQS